MKRRLLLLSSVLALGLCGCSSTDITKLTSALAKDPATVMFRATSVYGTVNFVRVGTTNGVTVSPDGTVTAK